LANFNTGIAEYQKQSRTIKWTGSCNYVTHLSNLQEVQNRYVQAANMSMFDGLMDLDLNFKGTV